MEARDPRRPPPSLVIVIDEFATLAKEVPDFVEGVVDVAQRGRSLGVHLVLATQRPGGVVSENIRANTNLRIALRVNEPAESTDVIGVPDAARISRARPGRAYARTGHGELTEFQAAYVGRPVEQVADAAARRSWSSRSPSARPTPSGGATRRKRGGTELTLIVAADGRGGTTRRDRLAGLAVARPASGDARRRGHQSPASARSTSRSGSCNARSSSTSTPTAACSSTAPSGAGKTTFLRTLALALAERLSPDELHVYGLDFASRGLTALEALPHVGSIVGGEDEERTERLFSYLRKTLERRKQLLARAGVFSLSDYLARPNAEPLPRILVLLDGYAALRLRLRARQSGRARRRAPAARRRRAPARAPLRDHGRPARRRPERARRHRAGEARPPHGRRGRVRRPRRPAEVGARRPLPAGRGFLPNGVEFQVAWDGDLAARVGARSPRAIRERTVPPIEPLPTQVARDDLAPPAARWSAAVGLGDADLEPVVLDLADRHFLVAGPYRGGRSTALATIVMALRASTPDLEPHLLAPRRTPLTELEGWASVAEGAAACDDAALRLQALAEQTPERPAARRDRRRRGAGRDARRGAARDGRPARPRRPDPRARGGRAAGGRSAPSPAGCASCARRSTASCSRPTRTSTETSSARGCRGGRTPSSRRAAAT